MARDDKLRVTIGKKRVERFKLAMLSPHKGRAGARAMSKAYDQGLINPLARGDDGKPLFLSDLRPMSSDVVEGNGLAYWPAVDKIARLIKLDGGDKCRGIGDGYDPDAPVTMPVKMKAMAYAPRPNSPFKRQSFDSVKVVRIETKKVYITA